MATLTRVFEFDAAHRVMNERIKCFNLHGHRFKVELTFTFFAKGGLGYAIDFKELKRIAGGWLDEMLDHACILNPQDTELIELCKKNGWRLYVMGLGENNDVNPSAENLASEILYSLRVIFGVSYPSISVSSIRLYETPSCWVDFVSPDYVGTKERISQLREWASDKGIVNYDNRLCQ